MKDNNFANQCIKCSVESCKYHNSERGYCSLDEIKVGTHEVFPTDSQCVDCESFQLK